MLVLILKSFIFISKAGKFALYVQFHLRATRVGSVSKPSLLSVCVQSCFEKYKFFFLFFFFSEINSIGYILAHRTYLSPALRWWAQRRQSPKLVHGYRVGFRLLRERKWVDERVSVRLSVCVLEKRKRHSYAKTTGLLCRQSN